MIWVGLAFGIIAVVSSAWVMLGRQKAQKKYDECLSLASNENFKAAKAACEDAVSASPNSRAGKDAALKSLALDSSMKMQEESAIKAAAARQQADVARQQAEGARVAQDAQDAKCITWHTICNTGGPAETFRTKAECEEGLKDFETIPGVKCAKPCKCLFVRKE